MYKGVWEKNCVISPSLITLDLCNLESEAKLVEESGLSCLHIDILDGHFSPSMPLGLDTVAALAKRTALVMEAHLMATEPQFFVDELLRAGVEQICFQIETAPHVDQMINYIHSHGVRAGVALKPATPLHELEYILEKCDTVLLMLINPGFAQMAGEAQVPYAERKIRELHRMIRERGLSTMVELDGRVSEDNIRSYASDGAAQIFAAGSTCIRRDDKKASLLHLKELEDSLQKTGS